MMGKTRSLTWFVTWCAGVCVVPVLGAWAWGPNAHVYMAHQIMGDGWPEALYGATCPDMYSLATDSTVGSNMQHLTHYEFDRLSPTPFAMGFATHNGDWGADYYAHCYYDPLAEDTYLTSRMRLMSDTFGISMQDAELVLEGLVDLLVRRDWGAGFGPFLQMCADAAGGSEEQQLVDAYAARLAQRMGTITESEAEAAIRQMAQDWKVVVWSYGQLVSGDYAVCRSILVSGLADNLGVDVATAETYVAWAEDECWDYQAELDRIARSMEAPLAELSPDYHLPLGRAGVLGAAIAIFLVARKRLACVRMREERSLS